MTFLARLAAHPADRTALLVSGQPISYGTLLHHAATLGTLLRGAGVGPEVLVGLAVERADFVRGMLGIWWAGGAFVPLDDRWPKERFAYIVRDAQLSCAVATGPRADWLRELGVRVLDPYADAVPSEPHLSLPHELAYAIYTSGSTGQPKGVLVEHRGLGNLFDEQIRAFQLGPTTRSLWLLSPAFDASVSDIGTVLRAGGTLVIEPDAFRDPATLRRLLDEHGITYVDLPPLFLTLLDPDTLPATLQTICIGGEPAAPEMVRRWAQRVRLVNVYGPTEATVCSSLGVCTATWDAPLLGQPLASVQYRVVDDELQMAGIGLARGYLNRPDLTAAKFVTHDGTRWYRTGDRVEMVNGEYVFRGRIDRQLKLRGQLVEPEEIEWALSAHPAITQAAVVKHGDGPTAQLVAFLVAEPSLTTTTVQEYLRQRVSAWMVPQRIVVLPELPRTTSGKIAYDALMAWPLPDGEATLSTDPLEAALQRVWQRVLQRPIVCDAGFLTQGGDSLRVLQCLAFAQAEGLSLAPHVLADDRPLTAVAAWLRETTPPTDTIPTSALEADAVAVVHSLPPCHTTTSRGDGVLLTGATGFLGQHVLRELRARGVAVLCLVRDRRRFDEHRDFVTVFEGDFTQPRFGLSAADWSMLTHGVGTVLHLGAAVSMVAPYATLRRTNVEGTANIVRFMGEGCAKHLHYASTLSVFVSTERTTGTCMEADDLTTIQSVHGGYAQSKYVAERFLRLLGGRYGPVVHYRFGLLTDPQHPHTTDFLSLFMRALRQLRGLPRTVNRHAVTDTTPVAYAAQAFVHLALQTHTNNTTFHIANPRRTTLEDLVASLGEPFTLLDDTEWYRRLATLRTHDPLAAALAQGVCAAQPTWDLFQRGTLRFDTTNTQVAFDAERTR